MIVKQTKEVFDVGEKNSYYFQQIRIGYICSGKNLVLPPFGDKSFHNRIMEKLLCNTDEAIWMKLFVLLMIGLDIS